MLFLYTVSVSKRYFNCSLYIGVEIKEHNTPVNQAESADKLYMQTIFVHQECPCMSVKFIVDPSAFYTKMHIFF
jgi:hypothetical protein